MSRSPAAAADATRYYGQMLLRSGANADAAAAAAGSQFGD